MAWQMAGILLTSVVIGLVYAIDRRRGLPDDEA
jgi:hypothetical protein